MQSHSTNPRFPVINLTLHDLPTCRNRVYIPGTIYLADPCRPLADPHDTQINRPPRTVVTIRNLPPPKCSMSSMFTPLPLVWIAHLYHSHLVRVHTTGLLFAMMYLPV